MTTPTRNAGQPTDFTDSELQDAEDALIGPAEIVGWALVVFLAAMSCAGLMVLAILQLALFY